MRQQRINILWHHPGPKDNRKPTTEIFQKLASIRSNFHSFILHEKKDTVGLNDNSVGFVSRNKIGVRRDIEERDDIVLVVHVQMIC